MKLATLKEMNASLMQAANLTCSIGLKTGLADKENVSRLDKLQQRCKCAVVLLSQAGKREASLCVCHVPLLHP